MARDNAAFTALLVVVFLSLGLVGVVNHEMWRDELQSWLIARDSSSIKNLFDNIRYESHPGLWYLILYLLTRFTHNPAAMQLSHLILATGVIYVFARFSPFTKTQKVLFCFGYFPFYEYAVISRNYALGILCVVCFCALFQTRTRSYVGLSFILLLLANTSVYGLIIAISFGLTLLFEPIVDGKIIGSLSSRKLDLTISLLVFAVGIVGAIVQIIPPPDRGFAGKWEAEFQTSRLLRTLTIIWTSYIPIPNFFSLHFWNTNFFITGPMKIQGEARAALSLSLLAMSLGLLARRPVALFSYLSGAFGILVFTYVVYYGKVGHHGHLFILFVASLWISIYYTDTGLSIRFVKSLANTAHRFGNTFVMVILYAHLAAGLMAFGLDFFSPFSGSKETSRFIKGQHLSDMLIVGSRDSAVSPLSGYLDRKIYYPESDRFGSFIIWDNKREKVGPHKLLEKVIGLITKRNTDALLVLNYKLKVRNPDLSIFELSRFSGSIIANENYYLYLIIRRKGT